MLLGVATWQTPTGRPTATIKLSVATGEVVSVVDALDDRGAAGGWRRESNPPLGEETISTFR